MTEATKPLPAEPVEAAATPSTAAPAQSVNATRLLAEVAAKSAILWIRLPDGATHPAWYVWHDDQDPAGSGPSAYVISGVGEQPLPWLPTDVELIFRSKDTANRVLTIGATTREITPDSPDWDAAAAVIRPHRLNLSGPADMAEAHWRSGCTIHVLTPLGAPVEQPGAYAVASGASTLTPARGTTQTWRPWHLWGRPASRRGTP